MPRKELINGEWMKICSKKECHLSGQYQPIDNFQRCKRYNDGLYTQCRRCRSEKERKRRASMSVEQKQVLNQKSKEWAKKNRDKINETRRKRRASMSVEQEEKLKQQQKRWQKTYRDKNRDMLRKKARDKAKTEKYRKRKREYYQNNELARRKNNVSLSVRNALKKQGAKKDYKTFQMLPYSTQDLKEHIENQFDEKMNWDNYGDYWHIDHIIPQAALPYKSLEDENFQKCWALENLRPLERIENLCKSSFHEGIRYSYDKTKTH